MAFRDVDSILKGAVEETLAELLEGHDDVEVFYHVHAINRTEVHACEDDEDSLHLAESLVWRLNLYVTFKGKYTALNAVMPYTHCFDGDPQPMKMLTRALWENFRFSALMLDQDLDKHLEAVAREVEKEA